MSWVYCSWFSPSLFSNLSQATHNDASWLLSIASCVLTIFTISLVLGRRRLSSFPALCYVASFGTAFATALEAIPSEGLSMGLPMWIGSLLSGLFSGLLWVFWSEYVGSSGEDVIKAIAPTSALVALACFVFSHVMPWPLSALFVAALPLASGMLFLRARRKSMLWAPVTRLVTETAKKGAVDGSAAVIRKVLLISFVICAISSFAWSAASHYTGLDESTVLFGGMMGGIALILLVTLPSSLLRKTPSVARLYRLSVPLLVASMCLLIGGDKESRAIAEMFLMALSMSLDFFVLIYFASYASRRFAHSERALCYCEGVINAGIGVGNVAGLAFLSSPSFAAENITTAYLILIAAAAFILMVVAEQQLNIDRLTAGTTLADACDVIRLQYSLTPREREILEFLGHGRSVPFISDSLFLAKSTVETHRKHIYEKVGVHNRQELLDMIDACKVNS